MKLPAWLTSRPPRSITDDMSIPDLRKLLRALKQARKDGVISTAELSAWYQAAEETVKTRTEAATRARENWGLLA